MNFRQMVLEAWALGPWNRWPRIDTSDWASYAESDNNFCLAEQLEAIVRGLA
jgi:hypothetical protein